MLARISSNDIYRVLVFQVLYHEANAWFCIKSAPRHTDEQLGVENERSYRGLTPETVTCKTNILCVNAMDIDGSLNKPIHLVPRPA
jgi:hypothetical protein